MKGHGFAIAVPGDDLAWHKVELPPGTLEPEEVILHHWPSPGGRGVLTNRRCLITTHPHPVYREVRWSEQLVDVRLFEVKKAPEASLPWFGVERIGGFRIGCVVEKEQLDDYYFVLVDDTPVFVGYVDHCAEIQRWIDEARAARVQAARPTTAGSLDVAGPPVPALQFRPFEEDSGPSQGGSSI